MGCGAFSKHASEEGSKRASQRLSKRLSDLWTSNNVDPNEEEDASSGSDNETQQPRPDFLRQRAYASSAEVYGAWNHRKPFAFVEHEKTGIQKRTIKTSYRNLRAFEHLQDEDVITLVDATQVILISREDCVVKAGDHADALYVVLHGALDIYDGEKQLFQENIPLKTIAKGDVLTESALIFNMRRTQSAYGNPGGTSIVGRLERSFFQALMARRQTAVRQERQELLKGSKLLEALSDEAISRLAEVLTVRVYEEGEQIITQGQHGNEFFVMQSGESVVEVESGWFSADVQEHRRYYRGDLFGERALLTGQRRAASVIACSRCEVLVLSRRRFERLLGRMNELSHDLYETDPRKIIADFYCPGDHNGPGGVLKLQGLTNSGWCATEWFAVYRPTSRDAIAKMLAGTAVGKGLNIKGKSAKKGVLSGCVPFIQISLNEHKSRIENPEKTPEMKEARIRIFYKSEALRKEALHELHAALRRSLEDPGQRTVRTSKDRKSRHTVSEPQPSLPASSGSASSVEDLSNNKVVELDPDQKDCIVEVNDWNESDYPAFGLEMPEELMWLAYIMEPDLTPLEGWETGRASEPAFMDMNLHALRGNSLPEVVLLQFDSDDPMNPLGLLVAYAEKYVKPVVSDFDTFTIGSTNMSYGALPPEQMDIVWWALNCAEEVLGEPGTDGWNSRWLRILERENAKGFHPTFPKYGFGDPISYTLCEQVVEATLSCGAVRHGSECFNFYFPQELDDEYLVVWEKFPELPWQYKTESQLREFLLERANEGYSFPLNPCWPVRDPGWFEVLDALKRCSQRHNVMKAWTTSWVPTPELLERIEGLHEKFPKGFVKLSKKDLPQPEVQRVEEDITLSLSSLALKDDPKTDPGHANSLTAPDVYEPKTTRRRTIDVDDMVVIRDPDASENEIGAKSAPLLKNQGNGMSKLTQIKNEVFDFFLPSSKDKSDGSKASESRSLSASNGHNKAKRSSAESNALNAVVPSPH